MIYLEHGMIIQHWLFTSLEGFHGSLRAEKGNFIILGKKILVQKSGRGGVGTSDPSSFRKSVVGSWEKILSYNPPTLLIFITMF